MQSSVLTLSRTDTAVYVAEIAMDLPAKQTAMPDSSQVRQISIIELVGVLWTTLVMSLLPIVSAASRISCCKFTLGSYRTCTAD